MAELDQPYQQVSRTADRGSIWATNVKNGRKRKTDPRVALEPAAKDLGLLLAVLPSTMRQQLVEHPWCEHLIEVVLDLGRVPEARFPAGVVELGTTSVTAEDLAAVVAHVGEFGGDNRAGIARTLHRISAIRNRAGKIVGLTCRAGRAVVGTLDIVRDVVESGQSTLLLGKPGVGKTTLLREAARVLAVDCGKRVIVVDTSNEIAGDGDIPHPGIGRARRMQVPSPAEQHQVMIEAVENHMPEVIVIDEIGTAAEVLAARTIAERGVQLIATAHGNDLENLLTNPTFSDLIGGIHAVTLSDEEARRRGTQKTVLERKGPPAFDVVIEIQERDRLAVHHQIAEVVDRFLRHCEPQPEVRVRQPDGGILVEPPTPALRTQPPQRHFVSHLAGLSLPGDLGPDTQGEAASSGSPWLPRTKTPRHFGKKLRVFPFAVSLNKLERAILELRVSATIVRHLDEADVILTLKSQLRRQPKRLREAELKGIRVELLKNNTSQQIERFLRLVFGLEDEFDEEKLALQQAEAAVTEVFAHGRPIELEPRDAYLRRLQHELIHHFGGVSKSLGEEPFRRVVVYPN